MDAAEALQKAMLAAMLAHAGLGTFVGTRIYDMGAVPEPPVHPYVVLGEYVGTDEDTKDTTGELAAFMLHVWDRQIEGRHRTRRIMAEISDCLHDGTLALDTGTQVFTYCKMKQDFLDGDGKSIHGVMRFETLLDH